MFGGNYWVDNLFHGGQVTPTPTPTPTPQTQLDIIMSHRSRFSQPIRTPHNFITLFGGQSVEVLAFEPEAATFRGKFYYNSRWNILFKKLDTLPFPVWKEAGNC